MTTDFPKTIGGMDIVHSGRPFVYAGGAVDYADRERTHQWRHDLAKMTDRFDIYCPICANADHPGVDMLMQRNELGLLLASRCVFLLDGLFTVGTPVEIAQRVERRTPRSVCIVHTAEREPGAFVQMWGKMGALILPSFDGVPAWLSR